MRIITENKGIALVTSLMLTLISMTIVMFLLYMVTSGIKTSGANKRYRSALDASYGATDVIINEVIPKIFSDTISLGRTDPSTAISNLSYSSSFFLPPNTDTCLMDKLTKSTSQWGTGCTKSIDPVANPDFTMRLNSTTSDTFTVYTQIVESVCSDKRSYPNGKCTGSDLSGYEELDGGLGTIGNQGGVAVQPKPAIYRIEVVGEKTSNPKEKSRLSVLYAY